MGRSWVRVLGGGTSLPGGARVNGASDSRLCGGFG
jgi:hypothetical protein